MTTRFGVFAKHWTPGRVKTRLAAVIGEAAAAMLHHQFLATLLARFADTAEQRWLFYDPAEQREAFQTLAGPAWRLHPQCAGDLGERMRDYFQRAFDDRVERVVLIGSDSPNVPPATVARAFDLLDEAPVVIGPSQDGGYYLIAARDAPPPIFDAMPWGSANVFDETTKRLQKHELPFRQLPTWYDIDEIADLHNLAEDLWPTESLDEPLQHLQQVVRDVLQTKRQP